MDGSHWHGINQELILRASSCSWSGMTYRTAVFFSERGQCPPSTATILIKSGTIDGTIDGKLFEGFGSLLLVILLVKGLFGVWPVYNIGELE